MLQRLRKYFPAFFPVEKRKTAIQTLEINRRNGHLVLDAPHVNYSFGNLHRVFQHAFQVEALDVSRLKEVLILGFGAGSVAHILQNELGCKAKITGVDIDKGVIDLAEKYFDLKALKHLDIQISDAFEFVKTAESVYDLVVVDLFLDHWIPEQFDTPRFMEHLKRIMLPGGMVFFNRLAYSHRDKQRTRLFEDLFREYFSEVSLTQTPEFSNNIVFKGIK
jgi:spermidine synthase